MRYKRFQFDDRRQINDKLLAPFKDSEGKLILGCRRIKPDRRIDAQVESVDSIVICLVLPIAAEFLI